MSEPHEPRLPIGYWLKKADQLLTARIDEAQQVNGVTRLEWQLLNTLHERGSASFEHLAAALHPFADAPALVEALERLVQREAVESSPGTPEYRLTPSGGRLHAAAAASQDALRRRAMEGISENDYATAVRVLQRIVQNLS